MYIFQGEGTFFSEYQKEWLTEEGNTLFSFFFLPVFFSFFQLIGIESKV